MFDDPVFVGISIGVSVAAFLGSLIAIPVVLIKMPEDYLTQPPKKSEHPALKVGKNLLGVALLAIGVAMLVLPGQGVLMIIVGLLLVDFPGRRKLLRKLMAKPKVQKAITAIRKRAGKPPLQTGAARG
jgi:hypothetical protein